MTVLAAHSVLHADFQRRPAVKDLLHDFTEALGINWGSHRYIWSLLFLELTEFATFRNGTTNTNNKCKHNLNGKT